MPNHKFKTWDAKKKVMSKGEVLKDMCWVNSDDLIFLQNTDYKDENGVEVYEGDMLEYWVDGYKQMGHYIVKDVRQLFHECNMGDSYYRVQKFVVVGNIHEGLKDGA